jgi:MFS family permease
MYCPKCAAQNGDDAKFCRVCGSNLSLIPQALTGQLPARQEGYYEGRRGRKAPSQQRAMSSIFLGFGFAVVALALVISGDRNGIWMLIPAFVLLGSGVGMYVSLKSSGQPPQQPFAQVSQPVLRRPTTGELAAPPPSIQESAPPSVTEGTTRILDHSAESSEQSR